MNKNRFCVVGVGGWQGRSTLWARWALAQGPAPEWAPLDEPLGKMKQKKRKKEKEEKERKKKKKKKERKKKKRERKKVKEKKIILSNYNCP